MLIPEENLKMFWYWENTRKISMTKTEYKEIEEYLKEVAKSNIYEFNCPVCKGKSKGRKASIKGHIYIKCEKCDIIVKQ